MMKAFFEAVDIIPVNRSDRSESLKALDIALRSCRRVRSSAFTPRAPAPATATCTAARLVAWLAHMTGAPVIPVGLIGTDRLQKPGRT